MGLSRRTFRGGIALLCTALIGGALVGPVARAQTQPGQCAQVMPTSQVQKGMQGTGWTVESGTEPQPFGVNVLGVLEDGMGPGRPVIVVDTSGPQIDRAGGIWAGMSGSPVYVNNQLIGAISLSFSAGPSSIGGVTPAEDMLDVLDYQTTTARVAPSKKVVLGQTMRARIARATNSDVAEVGRTLSTLMLPMSVSGVTPRGLERIRKAFIEQDLPFIPHMASSGSSTQQTQTTTAQLDPGDNFAAALSYGDVSLAGVGTTTYVCNGRVLAFGHPFQFIGATSLGANNADALAIIDDPVFSPFKLANIGSPIGVVDQDRLSAIRGVFGAPPTGVPITSSVTALDSGRTRDGRTDVLISEAFPFLAFQHLLANIDVTFDQIGEGSASASWTINGTRADGEPWTLTRTNLYASEFDIGIDAIIEIASQLERIFFNNFEEVEFTGVDADIQVETAVKRYTIEEVRVGLNGSTPEKQRKIKADPGDTVQLQVDLLPFDGDVVRTEELTVKIPNKLRQDTILQIVGGAGFFFDECFVDCDPDDEETDNFDKLLKNLEGAPHNNELIAVLRTLRRFKSVANDATVLDQVVSGFKRVRIQIKGGGGGGGKGVVSEPLGR